MKASIISVTIAVALIGGALLFANKNNQQVISEPTKDNVSVQDSKQIIEILAKGGYSPRVTFAKADIPTILRMKTQGSFDCSTAVTIPSIGYKINLPSSGTTETEIPPQKSGTILYGLCTMGMYNFQLQFK